MDAKETREELVRNAKRNLILDAARKIFAEQGFSEARLEDIAEACGFSKAALYNYYPDKETIFFALAARDFDRLLEALRQGLDPQARFGENLERSLRTVLSFFGEHSAFMLTSANFQAMGSVHRHGLSECHEKMFGQFKKKSAHLMDLFATVVKEGKRTGEIRADLDESVLTLYLESLIRGIVFQWRIQGKKQDIDREIRQLLLFLRQGLDLKPA